jgi:hypothetical protein
MTHEDSQKFWWYLIVPALPRLVFVVASPVTNQYERVTGIRYVSYITWWQLCYGIAVSRKKYVPT